MRLTTRRRLSRFWQINLTALLCFSLLSLPLGVLRPARAAAPSLHPLNFGPANAPGFFSRAWWKALLQQPELPNLDTLRNNAPQAPNAYVPTGTLPSSTYDDPKPTVTANYDAYLTQLAALSNQAGPAGATPRQVPDPTAGTASVGGLSIEVGSGRYNFSAPVVGLPGRAGLDLALALNYSSQAVWTYSPAVNTIAFNADRGFPAPGWRLGFGAMQTKDAGGNAYISSTTGRYSLLYIEPSGVRHELGYNSATGYLESYDSSYLKYLPTTQTLHFPNGAKMKFGAYSYSANNRDYQALPIEIKDRNGNFITIAYKTLPNEKVVIDYAIDTAGRRVDFYYENNRLLWIGQQRNGVWFKYVNLDYQPVTIQTNFTMPGWGGTLDPPTINGTQVWLVSRITYPTGLNFRFSYNGQGVCQQIQKWVPAINGQGVGPRMLAQTSFTFATNESQMLLAEHRVKTRSESAENWQGGLSVAKTYHYATGSIEGYSLQVHEPTLQHEQSARSHYFNITPTQVRSRVKASTPAGSTALKDEIVTYTSDQGLSYLSNQRVTEIQKISDPASPSAYHITQFAYTQMDGMSLPTIKDEKSSVGGPVYRRAETAYTSYPAQNVLGLPTTVSLYAGAGTTLLAKTSNVYDETNTVLDSNNQSVPLLFNASGDGVIQHDNGYSLGFTQRGNLTSVIQYSVVGGNINGSRVIGRIAYDTNGNVRDKLDAANNRQAFAYGDYCVNKPVGVGQTHVVPYSSADPTGFRNGSQWNYFTGQVVKSFNLLSGSSTEQQVVTTTYDFADRPLLTTRPDGGWVRTDYWDNLLAVGSVQQIDTGKVRFKWEVADGAGRTFKKASVHPDAVTGKYAGQIFVFNELGQVFDSSNVLAINGGWAPTAEDQSAVFLFTHLTRDGLSRLKLVKFPDNNTRQYDYEGCGCAGSDETRYTDELGNTTVTINDAFGRLSHAIEGQDPLNYYSKAVYLYDVADRLVQIQHSALVAGVTQMQTRDFVYDGFGRLIQETTPEAGTVTYAYTANDQVETKTDARNIVTTYQYDKRKLMTQTSYSGGSAPTVSYGYDAYGARQTMTDGEGQTSYSFNGYRQLQSETRTFTGLPGKTATLSYTYNQGDQVKSVNYSFGPASIAPPEETATPFTVPVRPARPLAQPEVKAEHSNNRRPSSGKLAAMQSSSLTASPNPIPVCDGSGLGITTLTWSAPAGTSTQIRIGAPDGALFAAGGASGSATTGKWVSQGTVFYLQNVTNGLPLTAANTLATVTVNLTTQGCPSLTASPNPIPVCDGSGLGVTTLNWTALPGTDVQIRVGAPDGALFAAGGASGSATTGKWVSQGTVFYLQNVTGGLPLTAANTLATVTVNVTTQGCPTSTLNKTINYAYNSVGALAGVGTNLIGSDPNNTTNVLNTTSFRATGAIKQLTYGNGLQLTMGYNVNRQQPLSMRVGLPNGTGTVLDYSYEYYTPGPDNKNNNRLRKVIDNLDSAYTASYNYDEWNRLTLAQGGASPGSTYQRQYTYDPFGNLKSVTGSGGPSAAFYTLNYAPNATGAPATNRLLNADGTWQFGYDDAGNLTSSGGSTFAYDGAGRMVSVNGGALGQYGYDGNGIRVKKVESGQTAYYVRSSKLGGVAFEVTSASVQRVYVYAGNGKLVAEQSTDGQFYWQHQNHLGSARAITNTSGSVVYWAQLDPHGIPLAEVGNPALTTRKFAGHEKDATGLDNMQARMYTRGRGRFLQPDPMGLKAASVSRPQSLNRYAYANNDPVNFVDPGGTCIVYWHQVTETYGFWDTMLCNSDAIQIERPDPSPDTGGVLDGQSTGSALAWQNAIKNAGTMLINAFQKKSFSRKCKESVIDKLATIRGFDLNQYTSYISKGANIWDGYEASWAKVEDYFSSAHAASFLMDGLKTIADIFNNKVPNKDTPFALVPTLLDVNLTIGGGAYFYQPKHD
jgi:RHS repeat-associated protein